MRRPKITIIGAGNVGASCAHWIAARKVGDLVLVDIVEGMPQGKALDLYETSPVEGFDTNIIGTNNYEETAGSDVIVITSGMARKPGMSRDDLLMTNARIVADVTKKAAAHSPAAVIVVVTNPLDAMTYVAWKASGFKPHQVVGQAGVLDMTRYKCFIADEVGCSVQDISALLMGGHGDDMVPLPRYTTIGGIPVTRFISAGRLEDVITRTRNGGAEIVGLLKSGSAFYAPSAATVTMVEAIIRDKRRVLPCACYCEKEYKVGGYFVGVPCFLGRNGVESVIEVELDAREREMFNTSVTHVKEQVGKLREFLAELATK